MNRLRLMLFKHSERSFLEALESNGFVYNKVIQLSEVPINSGISYDVLSKASELMPWNSLAKVISTWLEVRSSRQVIISMGEGASVNLKGYSPKQVEKILKSCREIMIIDTNNDKE